MVLTGRTADVLRRVREAADWRVYLSDPKNPPPELKARLWTPQNVATFVRVMLAPSGRRRR